MTRKLFHEDPYQKEFKANAVEILGNKVVLDQTCFYPEGGGQVGDTGEISGIRVVDTQKENGKIIHLLEKEPNFKVGDRVHGKIDWNRRYKIMRLHSAAHIMEHLLYEVFGRLERIGSRVDDVKDRCDYVYEGRFDPEKLKEVERLCNAFLSKNYEIKNWSDERNPDHRHWKCVDIEMACGGTHVKNTGEIGKIRLKRKNPGKGKERVETYLA